MSRWSRRKPDERLIEMAAEPVPPGSGVNVFGRGKYQYVKMLRSDGSTRIFRFRTQAEAERAITEGVAADAAREALDDTSGRERAQA